MNDSLVMRNRCVGSFTKEPRVFGEKSKHDFYTFLTSMDRLRCIRHLYIVDDHMYPSVHAPTDFAIDKNCSRS